MQLSSPPWSRSLGLQDSSLSNLNCLNCCLTSPPSYHPSLRKLFLKSSICAFSFCFMWLLKNFNHQSPFLSHLSPETQPNKPTGSTNIKVILISLSHCPCLCDFSTLRSPSPRSSGYSTPAFCIAPACLSLSFPLLLPYPRSLSCHMDSHGKLLTSFQDSLSQQPPIQLPHHLKFNLKMQTT